MRVVYSALAPFRIVNSYGLFRVMTKERSEIIIEGSDDAIEWKAYEFKWKPGALDRRPGWVAAASATARLADVVRRVGRCAPKSVVRWACPAIARERSRGHAIVRQESVSREAAALRARRTLSLSFLVCLQNTGKRAHGGSVRIYANICQPFLFQAIDDTRAGLLAGIVDPGHSVNVRSPATGITPRDHRAST